MATFWCLLVFDYALLFLRWRELCEEVERTKASVFKMLKERVLRCLRWRGLCVEVERSIIAGWCLGKREHAIVERGGGGGV